MWAFVKHDSYVNITVFCVAVRLIGWALAYQNARLRIPEYYNQCIRAVRISNLGKLVCSWKTEVETFKTYDCVWV